MSFLDGLLHDLRYGLRSAARRPGFAAVVVLTLGLGIGATTTIFGVADAVLVRGLPYEAPDRLVRLMGTRGGEVNHGGTLAFPNFLDVRERARTLAAAAAYDEWQPTLTGLGEPLRPEAAIVNASFFRVLGVRPHLGRLFRPEEDVDGRDRVIVLSHGLWRTTFGADSAVVGRTVELNGTPHTIVGVLRPGFEDPALSGSSFGAPRLWRPVGHLGAPPEALPSRSSSSWTGVARLAGGVTLEQAREEISRLSAALEAEHPEMNRGVGMVPVPLRETIVGGARTSLAVLLGAVGLLLLLAAANVGNLLLGRVVDRRRELAVRSALGAGSGRMARQLLVETLVLAAAGGAAGVLLAFVATEAVVGLGGAFIPRSAAIAVDPRVLAFAAGITVLTSLACGLLPVLQRREADLRRALGDGGRTTTAGGRVRRFRDLLVGLQVALAVLLLCGAGLLATSFWNLTGVDPGFEAGGVAAFELSPSADRYPNGAELTAFWDELLGRLRALPEVSAAAAVNIVPLSGSFDGAPVAAADRPTPPPGEESRAQIRTVTPEYFRAMRIPLRGGREFGPENREGGVPVAIVNEALAAELWPDGRAVGRPLSMRDTVATVVGVVGDVKHLSLEEDAPGRVYLARDQGLSPWQLRRMSVVLRAERDPAAALAAARGVVRGLDPGLPLAEASTLDEVVAAAAAAPRFRTFLLVSLAAIALLLAASGVYAVVAYQVARRVPEMAIRMAVGASSRAVRNQVVGEGLRPVLLGAGAGVLAAAGLSRLLASFLFGVDALDPRFYLLGAALLTGAAFVAALLPARRLARVDPGRVLQAE